MILEKSVEREKDVQGSYVASMQSLHKYFLIQKIDVHGLAQGQINAPALSAYTTSMWKMGVGTTQEAKSRTVQELLVESTFRSGTIYQACAKECLFSS